MGSRSIKYLVKEGFRSIWANRMMSFASVAVLMSCLVIMGTSISIFANINSVVNMVDAQNVIMVFANDGTDDANLANMEASIKHMDNVGKCEFVSGEDAWEEQMQLLDEAQKDFFEESKEQVSLPDGYKVEVKDMERFSETVQQLEKLDNVQKVRANKDVAQQLVTIRQSVTIVAVVIIAMLFAVSMFIISNTIKLTMYSRRLEINIMKSVGATDAFVKIPFIVEGMVLGLISAIVSLLLVWGIYEFAISKFDSLFSAFGATTVKFSSLGGWLFLAFVVIGVLSGTVGSVISMQKYLRKEGSEISVL